MPPHAPVRWLFTTLCLLSGCLLCSTASAGDRLAVTRVSFNAGGNRALVMVQGRQDGSGFAAAQLHLLNTLTGRHWQASAQARADTPTPSVLMQSLLRAQWPSLRAQGYRSGTTSAPRYLRAAPALAPSWAEGVGVGQTQTTSVTLWTRPVPVQVRVDAALTPCPHQAMLPAGQRPARFTLTVNGQQVAASAVPCAARYSLERVDVKGNRAVFTLRAYTPGFEGPNAEPLFIATTLR